MKKLLFLILALPAFVFGQTSPVTIQYRVTSPMGDSLLFSIIGASGYHSFYDGQFIRSNYITNQQIAPENKNFYINGVAESRQVRANGLTDAISGFGAGIYSTTDIGPTANGDAIYGTALNSTFSLGVGAATIAVTTGGSSYTNGTYHNVPILDVSNPLATNNAVILADVVISSNHVASVTPTQYGSRHPSGNVVQFFDNSLVGGTGSGFIGAVASNINYTGVNKYQLAVLNGNSLFNGGIKAGTLGTFTPSSLLAVDASGNFTTKALTDYLTPTGSGAGLTGIPLSTGITGILPVANGGSGTSTPALVPGTNITITGTWPNQTINASGGGGGGSPGGAPGELQFQNSSGGFGGVTNAIYDPVGGNLGIANVSPVWTLDVGGVINTNSYYFISYLIGGGGGLLGRASGTNTFQMGFSTSGDYSGTAGTLSGAEFFVYDFQTSQHYWGFGTGGDSYYGPNSTSYSLKIQQPGTTNIPLSILGSSGQTANLMNITANGGSTGGVLSVFANGDMSLNNTTDDPNFVFQVNSTTQGTAFAGSMTTTQRTAISSPTERETVYDSTLHTYMFWNGTTWTTL
jgi:hypothetical protein